MKKEIQVSEFVNEEMFTGSLSEIRKNIATLIEKYGEHATLVHDSGYNNISSEISFSRQENDKEYQDRLKQENKDKIKLVNKEKREFEEYLRLHEKFKNVKID
jgi:hypothetical protein